MDVFLHDPPIDDRLSDSRRLSPLRARIGDDLAQAMKDRDMARAKTLRTTLSAIQNAEAVEGVSSVEGVVGYKDVQRRSLDDEDIVAIIALEIEEFERSVEEYERIGQTDRARGLKMELEVLRGYLPTD